MSGAARQVTISINHTPCEPPSQVEGIQAAPKKNNLQKSAEVILKVAFITWGAYEISRMGAIIKEESSDLHHLKPLYDSVGNGIQTTLFEVVPLVAAKGLGCVAKYVAPVGTGLYLMKRFVYPLLKP